MPAKSKSQQKAAGAALAAKRGEQKVSDLKGPAKSMYESMSERQLDRLRLDQAQGQTGARLEEEVIASRWRACARARRPEFGVITRS